MKIKSIDNIMYLIDQNNNMVNLELYDMEEARLMLKSLVNCIDCIDCKDCVGCINCNGCLQCLDCINCINCIWCNNCKNCLDQKFLYNLCK